MSVRDCQHRILLTGGSACGKSSYAEQLVCSLPGPRYYLATMRPYSDHDQERIQRHRAQREGKGFITITTTADQKFTIRAINGLTLRNVSVNAGSTTTVNLPAGIYIVNNTKITVK